MYDLRFAKDVVKFLKKTDKKVRKKCLKILRFYLVVRLILP